MTNALVASAFHGVYDNPSFDAQLLNSLILKRGTGSPTFTRSDTANYSATVTDFEGLIRPVKNGEARFEGARRVENFVTKSEDFSGWFKFLSLTLVTGQTDPFGGNLATRYTAGANGTELYLQKNTTDNRTYNATIYIRRVTGTGTINISSGSVSNGFVNVTSVVSSSWKRISVTQNTNSTIAYCDIRLGTSGDSIDIFAAQWEDVTGQSNQNPSEYVSVGVLSAPYHGAGVDGVKYFTTTNGNTVSSNVVTEAAGSAISDSTLKGYLAEGTRTNLFLQSETINNTYGATRTLNIAVSPSGTMTADYLTENSADSVHEFYQTFTYSAGTTYTGSIYVKKDTRSKIALNTLSFSVYFNLDTGSVTSTSGGATATIINVGNSWYRCSMTFTPASSDDFRIMIVNSSGLNSYLGDGISGLYFWGAQLEASSFASSYIPTGASAVTRGSDVLSYPVSGNVGLNIGSAYAEVVFNMSIPQSSISGYGANYILDISSNSPVLALLSNQLYQVYANEGGSHYLNNPLLEWSPVKGTKYKIATAWSASGNRVSGALNGNFSYNSAARTITLTTNLSIGVISPDYGTSENPANATIRNVKIWKVVKPDTFLKAITT